MMIKNNFILSASKSYIKKTKRFYCSRWKSLFPSLLKFNVETTSFVLLISLLWFCYTFIFPHITPTIDIPPYHSHPYHSHYCDSPIPLSSIPFPLLRFLHHSHPYNSHYCDSLIPLSFIPLSLLWSPHTTLTHITLTIAIPPYHSHSYHSHYCDSLIPLSVIPLSLLWLRHCAPHRCI